jgi:hypothetical protein
MVEYKLKIIRLSESYNIQNATIYIYSSSLGSDTTVPVEFFIYYSPTIYINPLPPMYELK